MDGILFDYYGGILFNYYLHATDALDRFNTGTIYRHLAQLILLDAVIPSVAVLIRYIVDHSNLKVKWKSVYRQINRYIGFYQ